MLPLTCLLLVLGGPPASGGTAALRTALGHPAGRAGALRNVPRLNAVELAAARRGGLGAVALGIALDPAVPFAERARAIRAVGLLQGPAEPLQTLLDPAATEPEAIALAREAARTLAAVSRGDLLGGALGHPDPEIRARAAATGVGGPALCAVLEDPWPDVRRAAAQGLGAHPDDAACLQVALGDPNRRVVAAAIPAVADAGVQSLTPALRGIAGNPKAAIPLRAAAVLALGRLGDLEPATRILGTHLEKGGILPLADAAVRAFTAAGGATAKAHLRGALASPADAVRVVAIEGLAHLGDTEATDAIRATLSGLRGRQRARAERALARLAGAGSLETADPLDTPSGDDPAATDPE